MTNGIGKHPDGRIVVGVDGSEESKDALAWAARQAELTGATLQAVMTWNIPTAAYTAFGPVLTDYDFGAQADRTLHDTLREVLGEHPGLQVSTEVVESHPAPKLLEAAEGADLLVVGSRGHGKFSGMLLGSVSEHCVSHSPCPVVVVRHSPHPA